MSTSIIHSESTGVQEGVNTTINRTQPIEVEVRLLNQRVEDVLKKYELSSPKPLQGEIGKKVSSIKDLEERLKDAIEHSIRDKVLGVILIALAVVVAAAAIVLVKYVPIFLFTPIPPLLFLIAGTIARRGCDLLRLPSLLKNSLKEFNKELVDELEKCKKVPPEYLLDYQTNVQELWKQLGYKMNAVRGSLQVIQALPVQTEAGEADLKNRLIELADVRHQVALVHRFFQNSVPSAPPLVQYQLLESYDGPLSVNA